MTDGMGVRRRHLLTAAAGALVPGWARGATPVPATPFQDAPSVLVAGPEGGALDRWAGVLAPSLGRALPDGVVRETRVGGVDGVTGANQFATRVAPDGDTVLLAPGDAALAWLTGDPRARFDAANWLGLLVGAGSGVLVGRAPLVPGNPVRIAVGSAAGPDLPALVALDLLGVPFAPRFGVTPDEALKSYIRFEQDLLFLHGPGVPARLAGVPGLRLFSLGGVTQDSAPSRDPLLPEVPHLPELHAALRGAPPSGALYDAWRATASASQLAFGMVLPRLTPAPLVAVWRHAAASVVASADVQAMAARTGTRPLAAQAAAASIAQVAADTPGLLALREWLATRFG